MNNSLFDLQDVLFEVIKGATNHKLKGQALRDELDRGRLVIASAEAAVKIAMAGAALYRMADNSKSDIKPIRKLLGQGGDVS
jgi:hypothetical protein